MCVNKSKRHNEDEAEHKAIAAKLKKSKSKSSLNKMNNSKSRGNIEKQ